MKFNLIILKCFCVGISGRYNRNRSNIKNIIEKKIILPTVCNI